jgi:multiple sugar transport system permease protein
MKSTSAINRLSLPTRVLTYGMLWFTVFVMLAPLFWTVLTALKPNSEVFTAPYRIDPATLSFKSFSDVFAQAPFMTYFLNTLKITLACTLGVAATSALSGYAFARLQFPGRDVLFMIYLATMMIPRQVTLVPMFILMKDSDCWTTIFRSSCRESSAPSAPSSCASSS